jgi:hypothetical protein
LKFSCPRGLDIPTEGGEYVENFNSRFLTRLQEAGLEDTVLLHVDHHTEILDQVGL